MNAHYGLLAATMAGMCGCMVHSALGPAHNEFQVIERDDSEALRVKLQMGAGDLKVGGGTEKLARADFLYNVEAWKPEVHYSSTAKRGLLTIDQPSSHGNPMGNVKYEWDVRLNREVLVELEAHLGAGSATLDLGGLSMQSVDVQMGVGELKMDLRGQPKRDYSVHIRGGVGEATIRVPMDVGVYATATGGIGDVSATGLRQEEGHFRNEAYGHSKTTIRLDIQGGVGSVRLIAE
jgi:hypothetical protein